jgi:hypothetical protein
VHNLDRMSTSERAEFMNSCSGKGLRRVHRARAASSLRKGGLGAAALAASAHRQPATRRGGRIAGGRYVADRTGCPTRLPGCDEIEDVIVTGGVLHGDQAEWADDGKDAPRNLPSSKTTAE